MLPEGTFLYIVDEADGGKVHVGLALILDDICLGNVAGFRGASHRSLRWHWLVLIDGPCKLR